MNTPSEGTAPLKRGPLIAALLLGSFVSLLNQTLINVALPRMMDDLDVVANTAQWLTTGFMLVNGVLVPVSAYLMARFTARALFIAAMIFFSVGTVVCIVAPGFPVLLTGRLIQACGAGILMPLMTVVFLTIFPIEKRGQAMGLMGLAMIFAPAVGPTLSGWIIEHQSWRVLFIVVLPIALFSLVLGLFTMRNVTQVSKPKLDVPGVILSTLGFGGLLYGFSEAGTDGWGGAVVIGMIALGAASLILLVWRQLVIEKPLLEFRVFKYDMFSLTMVINVALTMSLFAAMILVPIYLQTIRGFTPLHAGLLLLPGAILMGIMSPITGRIFDKVGARWLAVTGLFITVVTTWEFSRLTESTTYTQLLLMYTARMFGISMLMMPIMTAGLNQLPQRLNAHGTAMYNTLRTIAGALGTALLVSVMSSQAKQRAGEMMAAAGVKPTDAAAMAQITKDATIHGINYAFMIATWISAFALVLAFFIRKTSPQAEFAPGAQMTVASAKQGGRKKEGTV